MYNILLFLMNSSSLTRPVAPQDFPLCFQNLPPKKERRQQHLIPNVFTVLPWAGSTCRLFYLLQEQTLQRPVALLVTPALSSMLLMAPSPARAWHLQAMWQCPTEHRGEAHQQYEQEMRPAAGWREKARSGMEGGYGDFSIKGVRELKEHVAAGSSGDGSRWDKKPP